MRRKKFLVIILLLISCITLLTGNVQATQLSVQVDSPYAILMESKTGRILYEKNANEKRYPASTTKTMTALITLEQVKNLEDKATISYDAIYTVPSGYSTDLLKVGEEISVKDLLYALLVKSSNEAANVLAEYVAGSVESFATMMNTRAIELGCKNTNFVNPNGVQDENHYSTAYDLALIAQEAMKNEIFREIVSTASYTLPKTNKYDRVDRTILSTNELIKKTSKNYYEYAIGIKTGYTTPAKNCLIAGANKDGIELIAVILGADEYNSERKSMRDTDVKNLFNTIYENFSEKQVLKEKDVVKTVEVKNATKDTKKLDLIAENSIETLVTNDKLKTSENPEIMLNAEIKAPIEKGAVLGSVKYTIDGLEYEINLLASKEVEKSNAPILWTIAIILILLAIGMMNQKKKKRKRTRTRKNRRNHYIR